MADTFIDSAEHIVDEVAEWGIEFVEKVVDSLAPDGRAYGMEKRSQKELVREYNESLRGNPDAWRQWIEERATRIVTLLQEQQVPEEEIVSVHPYSIAEKYAVAYSAQMERRLRKEEEKAREETLRPLPSPVLEEQADGDEETPS